MTTPNTFPLIELRRYTIADNEREAFAHCFDTYFPEAFQQSDAIAFGQFLERDRGDRYTWIRGFRDSASRAQANAAFYGGPVWAEYGAAMNARMLDHTDVRLLQPVAPGRALSLLPAVDAWQAPRPAGAVIAWLMSPRHGQVRALEEDIAPTIAHCGVLGAREAGLLEGFEGPNSFPRLPVRDDGPFLVWLATAPDAATALRCIAECNAASMRQLDAGLLREPAELLHLQPTPRSRLRWRER